MTDEHTHGRRSFLKRIGAATTLAGLAGQGSAAPAARTVIVGVEDGATIEEVRADIDADPSIPGRARVVHHNEVIDYAVVEIPGPSPQANERAHEAVGKHSSVRYAEQDYEITLAVEEVEAITPNDPRWGDEWAEQAMNVPTAWETTLGSLDTTLAILDTGLDVTHEDLAPRTTDEIGGSDPVPSGADDHGTHCGGCAAATTGNGVGVSGVSNARLLGYNIFDNSRGEDAIIEAADLGADVISLSWSVGYSTQQSLADAIQYATDQGTVVVAASANDGRTDSVTYPALDPNVIAVGATDQNGNVASFSNSGPELDVVAPGVSILSTLPQNSYGRASGTSMACPNTAGVVALAKELDPSLTTEEVRTLLTETATTLSGVPAGRQAAGQVDAAAVVDRLSVEQGPYGRSSPWPVPGRIQAEDYDVGGQGEAYNDTESANVHGAYRSDGVDIEQSAGGGYDVAEIRSGEWLEYTVSVASDDTYDLTARVSSDAGGGAFRVAVDGTDVTGTVDVPATGGWQSWTTVSATGVDLSAGEHVVRLTMEEDLFNLDWFEFTPAPDRTAPSTPGNLTASATGPTEVDLSWNAASDDTGVDHYEVFVDGSQVQSVPGTSATVTGLQAETSYDCSVRAVDAAGNASAPATVSVTTPAQQAPYEGPHTIPGRIQAENFDTGGQGVAYNDTQSRNLHGAYRDTDVDIEQSAGGGYDVAEIRSGEWLEYTVTVEQAGTYDLTARVSSNEGGGAFRVAVDGTDVTGTVDVPATGSWQSWTTVTAEGIDLSAGEHVVRLTMEEDLFNIDWFEFSAAGLVDGATYQITNVTSGKALDVAAGSTQDGANVHQWEYVGGDNQHWTLEAVGDGTYRLLAAHSGKALDVAGISDQDGANVHQWAYVGGANQHWRIEPVGDGSYRLLADHSGKALDVSGAGTTDGTNVQQWPVNGNDAQHWTFQER